MELTDYQRIWLQRRASQSAPQEACGFIFEDGVIAEIRNVASNPNTGFEMDVHQAMEKIRDNGFPIVAIWHTHPSGLAYPSEGDMRAITEGAIDAEWTYIVATANQVETFDTNRYAPQEDNFWAGFAK